MFFSISNSKLFPMQKFCLGMAMGRDKLSLNPQYLNLLCMSLRFLYYLDVGHRIAIFDVKQSKHFCIKVLVKKFLFLFRSTSLTARFELATIIGFFKDIL